GVGGTAPPSSLGIHLSNDERAVVLESSEARLQGVQHVLSPQRGLITLGNLPDQFLLARDLALALSDVTVGLHQMPALLVCHRSPPRTYADDWSARCLASVILISVASSCQTQPSPPRARNFTRSLRRRGRIEGGKHTDQFHPVVRCGVA